MNSPRIRTLVLTACAVLLGTAAGNSTISEQKIRDHVRYLASDELGGRAPGSPGEELAVAYITEQLRAMDCEPGNPDGTWEQRVPLYGYTVTNRPTLAVRGLDDRTHDFIYGNEFVGWTLRQQARVAVDGAELVFVGYGVDAPEYGWNDYRGADVKGKVIVMLVNDPPLADASKFGGKAMTYYGRWTYKYEEAAAQGAAGAIIVHNTEDAGYPWAVVENSWSGEQFDVVRADRGAKRCALESWITEDAARALFAMADRNFDREKAAAIAEDFQPFALGLTASTVVESRSRTIESRNVVGKLTGTDPTLRDDFVIYTAHWDHLGIGKAADGDSIYNGALDNASGVGGVIEIARAFASNRESLKRSVLFMFTTGEESGLLGATYYTENPLYPLTKTVAEINVDGLNIWGRTGDIVAIGYGKSNLDDVLAEAAAPEQRVIKPDAEPEKGGYYRSDHFPFAKQGVPALYADSGLEFRDRPRGWGMDRRREYVAERYHKPQDEYLDTWDLSGAAEDMETLYRVGHKVASSGIAIVWKDGSEFKRIREAMLRDSK
ncbi:MAG TPA: M28 family metallopeptidase [Candidatus Krumholzibacteria bacterium]|nr:M28 family metallopeptidase [Candidatus Krumholzibacteria bacterium]